MNDAQTLWHYWYGIVTLLWLAAMAVGLVTFAIYGTYRTIKLRHTGDAWRADARRRIAARNTNNREDTT